MYGWMLLQPGTPAGRWCPLNWGAPGTVAHCFRERARGSPVQQHVSATSPALQWLQLVIVAFCKTQTPQGTALVSASPNDDVETWCPASGLDDGYNASILAFDPTYHIIFTSRLVVGEMSFKKNLLA